MSNLKYSRQRESIKNQLMQRRDHPTADMIYTDIRKEYPHISLGTVYRNLALLSEIGEIRRLATGDGADRFDAITAPHNHFICRKCHAVMDMDMDDLGDIKEQAQSRFEGIVENYSVNFYGICKSCIDNVCEDNM